MMKFTRPVLVLLLMFVASTSWANLRLTILHNNDGESHLTAAGTFGVLPHYGNVCRFQYVLDSLRTDAALNSDGSILLSSGDNFLAGPEYDASVAAGFSYDALALDAMGYSALSFGNHDFDFGPDITEDFVSQFYNSLPPFLCANADFTGEPGLDALVTAGRIKRATTVVVNGDTIGIIGAITPLLPFISTPRNVVINPDVAGVVQAQIDSLTNLGINKIILIAHLQSIQEDQALIGQLHGLDLAIAGGGSEVLSNGEPLVPGDAVFGPYPLLVPDLNNNSIPVITTEGAYKYVGKCVVEFDNLGNVVSAVGGPVRVNDQTVAGGVPTVASCQSSIVDPVNVHIAALASTVIGATQVALEGRRAHVRRFETNEGNLAADALLWQANELADQFGAPHANVGLQNGGGIRNNAVIPVGQITLLHTFSIFPFSNFTCIVPNIPATQLKEIIENCVSRTSFEDGRYGQWAGLKICWDSTRTAQVLDANLNVTTIGERVRDVQLADGTWLVRDGAVVSGAPSVNIATIDFSARGGDQFPFRGAPFVNLGVSYQQALANYISTGLGGIITAADYPADCERRVFRNFNQNMVNGAGEQSLPAFNPVFANDRTTGNQAPAVVSFPAQTTPAGNPGSVRIEYTKCRPAQATDYWLPPQWTIQRYFTITPSTENFQDATLEFRFTACDLPSGIADPYAANLTAAYSLDGGATWVAQSGALSGPVGGIYSYTVVGLNHLSMWALGAGDRILPVELTSVEAVAVGAGIEVRFSTATESDNSHFEIFRSTAAAGNFDPVARLESRGNSSGAQNYEWTDTAVEAGTKYWYYLVSVDISGTRTDHHDWLVAATAAGSVELPLTYSLSAYPNPFNPTTTLSFTLPTAGLAKLQLYDVQGREVADLANGEFESGQHTLRIDARGLPSGIYIVRMESGDFSTAQKLMLLK